MLPKIKQLVWSISLIITILLWTNQAIAGPLAERIENFPNWENKPSISLAEADLIYPDWIAGNWNVKSTLIEMVAPLAPEIVTPGFENNRSSLNQPIKFQVRFIKFQPQKISTNISKQKPINLPIYWQTVFENQDQQKFNLPENAVIADREFNGLNIGKAILGENNILSVKVDQNNPNQQTTTLPKNLKIVSIVSSRGSERLNPNKFITCEITKQIFQSDTMIYLNEVETTTKYNYITDKNHKQKITADQITAIYLSPQDPDYFVAGNRPVALYRYQLELSPIKERW
ncbi:MAG: hypothetical protein QNJ68_23465 [Microcoleaceae cyanobacterium MO_207.B10]|nr:hypothetical protein [Microcoleaceae cyanobacterium MO_207.B10]